MTYDRFTSTPQNGAAADAVTSIDTHAAKPPGAGKARRRLGLVLGLLVAAGAVLATQALPGGDEWVEDLSAVFESGESASIAAVVNVPDETPVSLASEQLTHDPTVGKLAGEAAVNGGAASYSVPIALPPGRRGMQPELSLNYSSRSGNGIAGMGWSLSATSAVSRCPSTLEQDGIVRPVELDALDKLCLDGARLVATSGTYGQIGATYATEIESFSRVTQLGGALSSAAAYFKVETKSGDIVFYGGNSSATNPARVIPGNVALPMTWLIERRQDRVGNFVRYAYTSFGNGENLLSQVFYTGFGSTDGDRSVEMVYETRPTTGGARDQSSNYLADGLTRSSQRLKQIITWVGIEPIRSYVLAYQISGATGRSLLKSVTDCAYSEGVATCRKPTMFTWQSQPIQYRFGKLAISSGVAVPDQNWKFVESGGGDFNGDGATEVWGSGDDPANPGVQAAYLLSLSPERKVTAAVKYDGGVGVLGLMYDKGVNADFDLDGRTDVVEGVSNRLVIRFWHGPANATTTSQAFTNSWDTGIEGLWEHSGDMNGDGRPDLVVQRVPPNANDGCRYQLETYLNRANPAGPAAPATFEKVSSSCLRSRTDGFGRQVMWETVSKVSDLNGDGLPEIFIEPTGHSDDMDKKRIYWGCNGTGLCTGGYALLETYFNANLSGNDPRANYISALAAGATPNSDVNGDGLDDWGIRLNTGRGFAPAGTLTAGAQASFAIPVGMGLTRERHADIDGDGQIERLTANRYVTRVCFRHVPQCPPKVENPLHCDIRYLCPEEAGSESLPFTRAYFNGDDYRVGGLRDYEGGAYLEYDFSAYGMQASRYVEVGPGNFRGESFETPIIHGYNATMGVDLFGDGLVDGITKAPCAWTQTGACAIPTATATPIGAPLGYFPTTLPDGSPAFGNNIFINENRGPGGVMNPDGLTPQTPDLMSGVTDGMGVQTVWTYYPLSSKAGRTAGELPLYTLPTAAADRYIDDRHFYFTSSMPVVSDMIQSDGVGDFRSWRYGYSEAMYHARGRGFQGFRTVVVEDEAAGTRTSTTFHQKFPLTSQPEKIVVNSLKRSGVDAPISVQDFTWRCNRANRHDTTACTAPSGQAVVKFPYLDVQQTLAYDAATADNSAGGTPGLLSRTRVVAADSPTCDGSFNTTSGYNLWGNLVVQTTLIDDGSGTAGYREFIGLQCKRTLNTFEAVDTANWWIDRLKSRTESSSIVFGASHTLPAGTENPVRTVTTAFAWNADRTLASQVVQPGVADQERTTVFGYPASNNYGLPTSVSVTASGDPNGARTVTTGYSADGYFAAWIRNPLNHQVSTSTRKADGQPDSVTDANGMRQLIEYDVFGLPVRVKYRGATDAVVLAPDKTTSVIRCSVSVCTGILAAGKVVQMTVQDGAPTQTVYSDVFGRALLTRQRLADNTVSHVAIRYNALGQVVSQTEPYRNTGQEYYTTFPAYDVLGRPTSKVVATANHDGRGDMVTTYAYLGRTTAIQVCGSNDTDTTGCLKLTRTTDSLGRHVETVDAKGGITRFWYDSTGNAIAIRDANSNVIKATYNALGQRTSAVDPNQGSWSFDYNALGEVLGQRDARGITTTTGYDKLGRPLQASATYDHDGTGALDTVVDTFTYDPAYAKGSPAGSERKLNAMSLRKETLGYDTQSRPVSRTLVQRRAIGGAYDTLKQETSYDAYYGRAKAQTYGNAETLWLRYSKYGHLIRESNAVTGEDYRVVDAVDARGNATQETLAGGNITAIRTYQGQTGQMLSVQYGSVLVPTLRKLEYRYDVFGNVLWQQLNSGSVKEDYQYDALHRLEQATRSGATVATVNYGYDAAGNFTFKSDFSTNIGTNAYVYSGGTCGGGPNAVKSVALAAGGTRTYCYDATGNMTSDNAGLAMRYDHTQRPVRIARGAVIQNFDYGPDGSRIRQWGTDGELMYFGTVERQYAPTMQDKTYVGSSVVVTQAGSTRRVDYLLTDRLGSVDALADSSGAMLETRGFDAFGKPRSGTWADATKLASTGNSRHGFTGHEHLNSLSLIHMNGRVYDYNLGRFTGVDPVIQFPLNSQSLNPYSYILNNPLSGTDPTGYSIRGSICDVGNTENANGCTTYEPGNGHTGRAARKSSGGNGSTSGQSATGAGDRQEQAATASSKGSRSGPSLWGGSGCGTWGPNECRPASTYGLGPDIDPVTVQLIPDEVLIAKYRAIRANIVAHEALEPVTIVEETLVGGGVGGVVIKGLVRRTAGAATEAGIASLRGASAEAGSIRGVNAVGGKMNCVNCVIATDATLAGRAASAMPGGPYRLGVLETMYGNRFGPATTIGDIANSMAGAGNGARGIVFGSRGSDVGHVFNVVNQRGAIRFIDGQTGKAARVDGYQNFQLLRTK
ncbi:toxin glutamine deamidase domain-containing protein [Montanilutibacter psychrotolerans]|uniref:toxin glutamine deamidase domain-containing protein n=1 Tax=Montanilutibacter psychrotolerans TaxID=1327343 RepID=UPI001681B862|nr:toxin glutamine deamidase domain-containing protein [Lysobacter psychrotolerans]